MVVHTLINSLAMEHTDAMEQKVGIIYIFFCRQLIQYHDPPNLSATHKSSCTGDDHTEEKQAIGQDAS